MSETIIKRTGVSLRGEGSSQSSATFFIPRPPPGKRVRTARFEASFTVLARRQDVPSGLPSVLRLNGKPAEFTSSLQCFDRIGEVVDCRGFATWDLTEQVRPIAERGGENFVLVPDLPPVVTTTSEDLFVISRSSGASILIMPVAFNYPWRHADSFGSLTITFEQECPKLVDLVLTPESVRPMIPPGNPVPAAIRVLPTQATVDARVRTCPPRPGSLPETVVVTFMIDPMEPMPGSPDAGGHLHNGNRPRGSFTVPATKAENERRKEMCNITKIDAQGVGTCDEKKTYFPPEVSGKVKIVADTQRFGRIEKRINVQVPGLILLPEDGPPLLAWRSTGKRPGLHTDNHWGTAYTKVSMQLVARDFFEIFGATLGINDMSLPQGGLFDIAGNWRPDHNWHRVGTSVDVDRTACVDPNLQGACSKTISGFRDFIGRRCFVRGQGFLARERKKPPPIHCEFPQ